MNSTRPEEHSKEILKSTGNFTIKLRRLSHDLYNICSVCGGQLPMNTPAFAGYDQNRNEIYVGDCCKSQLSELASHMYWWWTSYKRPSKSESIWRYMDFAKFVALLKDRAIYFSRTDCLGDHFEGARGLVERQNEWKEYCLDYYRKAYTNLPGGIKSNKSSEEIEQEAERLHEEVAQALKGELNRTFVSCWHNNDVESEAIWRIYCQNSTAGIALQTTVGKLYSSLDQEKFVKFGHVKYVDFRKHFSGSYDRIFWKRKSLSHEAEIRAVYQYPPGEKCDIVGVNISIDLENAIERVIVSPFSPPWFSNVLEETMSRFGVKIPVVKSELLEEPFF